jgi:hypothetical protein
MSKSHGIADDGQAEKYNFFPSASFIVVFRGSQETKNWS